MWCLAVFPTLSISFVLIHFCTFANLGFVGFSVPEGMKAKALMCNRSSIIPAEYDYVAILAGYPLYIKNENRLVALERYNGKYRIREISGKKLSKKELASVNKMLNSYQEKEQEKESKSEKTKP